MNKKIRIGVIGVGWWSAANHIPIIMKSDDAQLVSISRRDPVKLEQARTGFGLNPAQAFTDWRDQISYDDLDAVIISTSHDAHTEPAIAALKKGLHVFVEKPLSVSASDARAMVRAAENNSRTLMVGYNRRWNGLYRTVKSKIESGDIGTVRQINITLASNYINVFQAEQMPKMILDALASFGVPEWVFGDGNMKGHWKQDPDKGGGMFYDAGSHFTDLALWYASSAPESVYAIMESSPNQAEKYLSVQVRLNNGAHVTISVNGDSDVMMLPSVTIHCDGGVITVSETEAWHHKGFERNPISPSFEDLTPTQGFIDTLLGRLPNLSSGAEAEQVVALTEAAYRSANEGKIIRIS